MHSFAILGYNKKALITDVINQLEELKNLGYSHIKLRVIKLKVEDYDYGLGYLLKSQALSFRKETQEEYKARLEQQKLEEARKQDM